MPRKPKDPTRSHRNRREPKLYPCKTCGEPTPGLRCDACQQSASVATTAAVSIPAAGGDCGPRRWSLDLPEGPSINRMIALATKRSRRTRNGGWMKKAMPGILYDQALEDYGQKCEAALRQAGIRPPPLPMHAWRITRLHFRLHALRDPLELAAGAKWACDYLVRAGWAVDDGPAQLVDVAKPTQEINRRDRGISIEIEEVRVEDHSEQERAA